ncbi:MAG: hypothetical protein ACLP0A_00305 [Verrucomicrobiia bacterium]
MCKLPELTGVIWKLDSPLILLARIPPPVLPPQPAQPFQQDERIRQTLEHFH